MNERTLSNRTDYYTDHLIDIFSVDKNSTGCRFDIIDQHSKCCGFSCSIRTSTNEKHITCKEMKTPLPNRPKQARCLT